MDPSMDDPMSEEEEEEEEEEDDEDFPAGSGGSGKGVVVEGVEIAEEDVYAYGDPDDPLDRVLDVYLADELEDHLYLLQYPMRPADRPSSTPLAVKVKTANHLLEVEHAIKQGGKHFDKNAPAQLRQATQKHTGSRVRPATNFAFGVIRGDEFHLTPMHATMQMRPCFQHIDEAKALEIEVDLDDPDNGGAKAAAERPQQVSFKKKESERATAARKSTYAYKKSIEDAEPWVALEVHGQNDERSLDEFARMFVENEGDGTDAARRGTTAKEFPPCGRYLQGLDYMEEYDENGESFSAGGRGRSLDDSIDLATAGTSTYSPVKIPSTSVHELGGDAKIVGYLKLAHLVPFTVLLDVTNMPPDAVIQALSVEGRQRGLLLRGNWAARAADVWARGPPHAANCLSVAQCLLHKYGAISRPDLQRRFPGLDPVTLKEVLSRIAELDTVNRRWVPKLKDGLIFGMERPDLVELEEERWVLQESSLKGTLGEDILAPPSCPTFEPFVEVLAAAAAAASAASAARASASRSMPSFGVLRPGKDARQRPAAGRTAKGGVDADSDGRKPRVAEVAAAASKGKAKADPAPVATAAAATAATAAASSAASGGTAPSFAPKRHFKPKPKKRPAKTPAAAAAAAAAGAGKETAVKQEHEGVGAGGGGGVEESKDTAVAAVGADGGEDGAGESEGGSRGRRGTGRPRNTAAAAAAVATDGGSGSGGGGGAGTSKKRGAAKGSAEGSALPPAKEEPRETSGGSAAFKSTEKDAAPAEDNTMDEEEEGEWRVDAVAAAAAAGSGEQAGAAGKGRESRADKKAKGGDGGAKAKEEPVGRPKVKPRATRAKPKGK